jgi:tetratricopeptide (TPR) repeat protein
MKKLLFASISIIIAISASAQSGKRISAFNFLQAYNNKEGVANLNDAAQNIDLAAQDENTSKDTKTWWYRAQIYQNISSEPTLKDKYPKASLEAVLSYQTMLKLNDPKFKDWKDAVENMKVLTINLFNDGVTAFQAKKYSDSYIFFSAITNLSDVIVSKGGEVTKSIQINALRNAGLSAENAGDQKSAIEAYTKLLPVEPDSSKAVIYQSLINLNKKIKNTDEARRLTDEALAKYPDNSDIMIDKINFFFTDHKQGEAVEYLKKLNAKDPKNETVLYNLGVAYEVLGDTVQARKTYENLLVVNPNNYEGNFGLGAMIFNKTKEIQLKMNALTMSAADQKKYDVLKAERNSYFTEAKPYLLKAQAQKPDEPEVKKALTTIDAMTK